MSGWKAALSVVLLLAGLSSAGCGRKARIARTPRIGSAETGIASWYGHPYHGRRAANGEIYDMDRMTAAHRTLPFGTWIRVENLSNGQKVQVRIQDRGPFVGGRILDLSRAGAKAIDMIGPGTAKVKLVIISPPLELARTDAERAVAASLEPAPSAKPTAAPAPRMQELELFGVQVGAFRDRERAEQIAERFRNSNGSARVILRDASGPIWRVVVGEKATEAEAAQLSAELNANGMEGFVVRLDGPLDASAR